MVQHLPIGIPLDACVLEHMIIQGVLKVIEKDLKLGWSVYIGAAGMPGEAVFMGWKEHSKAKKLVSNSPQLIPPSPNPIHHYSRMVIQLAKQDGLMVIVSSGGPPDIVFNYKTTDVPKVLKKEGPIDVWVILCADSGTLLAGIRSMLQWRYPNLIVFKCLSIHGFLVLFLQPKYIEVFHAKVMPKIVGGSSTPRTSPAGWMGLGAHSWQC
ncbi:hypothetical protein C8R43DRAFT_1172247 [Mycena crocata]|nr:hypothetical protein C8R43DRAFT_1172247 [Mycena crocata]